MATKTKIKQEKITIILDPNGTGQLSLVRSYTNGKNIGIIRDLKFTGGSPITELMRVLNTVRSALDLQVVDESTTATKPTTEQEDASEDEDVTEDEDADKDENAGIDTNATEDEDDAEVSDDEAQEGALTLF